jgi:rubrerythrin
MERFSVREVVEMALQTERLGYQFYTEMSEKFQEDEKLKDLFDILAKEEMRHEHVFEGLLSREAGMRPSRISGPWWNRSSFSGRASLSPRWAG